jgi:hypothetical protein
MAAVSPESLVVANPLPLLAKIKEASYFAPFAGAYLFVSLKAQI